MTDKQLCITVFVFVFRERTEDDAVWSLPTPFPIAFYGVEYNELAVSSNGNIQFSQTSSYSDAYNIDFPCDEMDGAIFAFMTDMCTYEYPEDDIRTGVIGEMPNRTFVIDYQGAFLSNSQQVRFQVHFHEKLLTVRLIYGIRSTFMTPLTDPDGNDPFYVGVQHYRDTGISTRYIDNLLDFLQIDFETKPFVGFSGIPTEPLLITRNDTAILTFVRPIGLTIATSMEWTLTCESPTSSVIIFPLRICPIQEVQLCVNLATVKFSATSFSADAEFICTLIASMPSDTYLMVTPFSVSIHLPRLNFLDLPIRSLIVPMDTAVLQIFKPDDLVLPTSVGIILTCTMFNMPVLIFSFRMCVETDEFCMTETSAIFNTNVNMPSGNYLCVSTLGLGLGSEMSPLYNLPVPFTIKVVRPPAGYKLSQSTATPLSTEGFTNHIFAGS